VTGQVSTKGLVYSKSKGVRNRGGKGVRNRFTFVKQRPFPIPSRSYPFGPHRDRRRKPRKAHQSSIQAERAIGSLLQWGRNVKWAITKAAENQSHPAGEEGVSSPRAHGAVNYLCELSSQLLWFQ